MGISLDWIGSFVALIGAFIMSTNTRISKYGFVLFLISNVIWLIFGMRTGTYSLVVMEIGFTAVNIYGVYCWMVKNRLGRANGR